MGMHHCDKVSEQLQQLADVRVVSVSRSSWRFRYESARVSVRVLPGCCGILLFYGISGVAKDVVKLLKGTIKGAQKAQFGMLMLSLRSNSDLSKYVAKLEGWHAENFKNPRTKNMLDLWYFKLPELSVKTAKKKTEYPED